MRRVVLGCSGGLDSAVAVPWLAETYRAEVVALTLDLGQGGELEAVRDAALESGAARAHVVDVREEFARDYVLPTLRADVLDEWRFPMAAELGRLLVARKLVEIAAMENASLVAHGADQGWEADGWIGRAVHALNPALDVAAPPREWQVAGQGSRPARGHRPIGPDPDASCASANLWGRSLEPRGAEPAGWPDGRRFTRTRPAEACSSEPAVVAVRFECGAPAALNDVPMPLVELVAALDAIAGANGVGRFERACERREAPAAVVLHAAHAALRERAVPDRLSAQCRRTSAAYAALVRAGDWFTHTRRELDAFEDRIQDRLTGTVRIRLCRGTLHLVACTV